MADFKLAWNAETHTATVLAAGRANPAGSTDAGTFTHVHEPDEKDPEGSGNSHVYFQHVQELLYHKGVLDMASVTIVTDVAATPITAISVTPATASVVRHGTIQLVTAYTPEDASDKRVAYTTSNANIATVSQTGIVTAHTTGEATITVTSLDKAKTDTCVVTVTG